MDFKAVTDDLSGVMYKFPFRVPPYYALIIRSLVTLEGIALSVDSDFKILGAPSMYQGDKDLQEVFGIHLEDDRISEINHTEYTEKRVVRIGDIKNHSRAVVQWSGRVTEDEAVSSKVCMYRVDGPRQTRLAKEIGRRKWVTD